MFIAVLSSNCNKPSKTCLSDTEITFSSCPEEKNISFPVRDELIISRDGNHYASARENTLFIDGKEKTYEGYSIQEESLCFSPDSRNLAYIASDPVYSPDSKIMAYTAFKDHNYLVVVNGKEGKPYRVIVDPKKGPVITLLNNEIHYYAMEEDLAFRVCTSFN